MQSKDAQTGSIMEIPTGDTCAKCSNVKGSFQYVKDELWKLKLDVPSMEKVVEQAFETHSLQDKNDKNFQGDWVFSDSGVQLVLGTTFDVASEFELRQRVNKQRLSREVLMRAPMITMDSTDPDKEGEELYCCPSEVHPNRTLQINQVVNIFKRKPILEPMAQLHEAQSQHYQNFIESTKLGNMGITELLKKNVKDLKTLPEVVESLGGPPVVGAVVVAQQHAGLQKPGEGEVEDEDGDVESAEGDDLGQGEAALKCRRIGSQRDLSRMVVSQSSTPAQSPARSTARVSRSRGPANSGETFPDAEKGSDQEGDADSVDPEGEKGKEDADAKSGLLQHEIDWTMGVDAASWNDLVWDGVCRSFSCSGSILMLQSRFQRQRVNDPFEALAAAAPESFNRRLRLRWPHNGWHESGCAADGPRETIAEGRRQSCLGAS